MKRYKEIFDKIKEQQDKIFSEGKKENCGQWPVTQEFINSKKKRYKDYIC